MKAQKTAWFGLAVGLWVLLPAFASAQVPAYGVEYMGPGYGTMNNAGAVIGNESAVYPGAPWVNDGSGLRFLPLPGIAVAGSAADINDAGVIVGGIDTNDDYINDLPVKWTPDAQGGYAVELLPLAGNAVRGHAVAINNNGVILASGLAVGSLPTYTAYVIDGETVTHVGLSNPMDINDNGIILTNNQLYDYYGARSLGFEPLPAGMPRGSLYPASINNLDEVIVNILTTIIGHTRYHAIGIYTVGVGWDLFMDVQTIYSAGSINDHGDVTLNHVNAGCGLVYLHGLGYYCPASLLDGGSLDWDVGGASVVATDGTVLARGGNSGTSQFGLVRLSAVGDLPAPGAPINLVAAPHEPTWQQPFNTIDLSWNPADRLAKSYVLERRGPAGPDFAVRATLANAFYRDGGIVGGETYDYRVIAVGIAGTSAPSAVASAVAPMPAETEPPTVTILEPADGATVSGNVNIVAIAEDNVAVANMGVTMYGPLGSSGICSAPDTTSLTCSWNTRNLAPGRYTVQAYASDAMGNGGYDSITVFVGGSDPVMRTTIGLSGSVKKGVPTVKGTVSVKDAAGTAVRGAIVTATWTRPDGSSETRAVYSDRRGKAAFSATGPEGLYELSIRSVTRSGYRFDEASSELSDSITVAGGGKGGGKPLRAGR